MSCVREVKTGTEDELTRMALQELRKEAERGKQRSDTMGVTGWTKPKMKPNKRFLQNTLLVAARQRTNERDTRTIGGKMAKLPGAKAIERKRHCELHKRPHSEQNQQTMSKQEALYRNVKESCPEERAGYLKTNKRKYVAESHKR